MDDLKAKRRLGAVAIAAVFLVAASVGIGALMSRSDSTDSGSNVRTSAEGDTAELGLPTAGLPTVDPETHKVIYATELVPVAGKDSVTTVGYVRSSELSEGGRTSSGSLTVYARDGVTVVGHMYADGTGFVPEP